MNFARKQRVTIPGGVNGGSLAAIIDLPAESPKAFALYAHCFTCSKDSLAAARIGSALAQHGYGVCRFDFSGLGGSRDVDFADTNLTTNIADLLAVAEYVRQNFSAPQLLIGHSLGGIAVLLAAARLPEARAVVTLNTPKVAGNLLDYFRDYMPRIEGEGQAEVPIYSADRIYTIKKQFTDDLRRHDLTPAVANLNKPYLILYSPEDHLLGIEHPQALYAMAREPKQLTALPGSDHILTNRDDGLKAGALIAEWADAHLFGS